jgi:hypothetical protein
MKNKIKYIILLFTLFLILIPFIKQHTNILHHYLVADDLRGYFPPIDSAHFTLENWMDGTYQNQQEQFLKSDLKIRPYAVRVNNQFHYDALGEIRNTIVEGKDGNLFEANYIHSLQGLDFIGTKKIAEQVEKLKAIADYLKKENDVDIIVTVAMDKAIFFKEKLPEHYDLENVDSTNYETYLHFLKKANEESSENKIHVLDFNQYFLDQKEKSAHALATKHGVHWSLYGGLLATDSIQSYIGKLKGKENEINRLVKSEITKTTEVRKEDDDIGQSINLYFPLEPDTFSYFENYLVADKKPYKPNVALIGDSFCWTIWGQDIPHHYWGDSSLFLYYYNDIYDIFFTEKSISGSKFTENKKLPFVERQDVIVLLFTPMNMNNLGNGFIDETYDLIFKK